MKYSNYMAILAAFTALTACSTTDSDGDQELSYTYTAAQLGELAALIAAA